MTRRLYSLIAVIEVLLFLAAVYCEPTFTVRGKVHGEAFFEGKSTSWWRRELEHWDRVSVQSNLSQFAYVRSPTALEHWCAQWLRIRPDERTRPSLLSGNELTLPVLHELFDDPNPKVQRFATDGILRVERTRRFLADMALAEKAP
jgi:hypothetical protein